MLKNSKFISLGAVAFLGLVALLMVAVVFAAPVRSVAASGNASPAADVITLTTKGSTTVWPILYGNENNTQRANAKIEFEDNSQHMIGAGNSVALNLDPYPGAGSGAGLQALCTLRTTGVDIAPASRAIKTSDCPVGGVFTATDFVGTVIARDALAIIASSNRTATCIKKSQLINIYSANPTTMTWGLLGDTYRPSDLVVPRARITDSGTRSSFLDFTGVTSAQETQVISNTGLARLQGNPDVVSAIAGATPNYDEIGYVGLGFVENTGIKGLQLDWEDGMGCVDPSEANVLNNTYGMRRNLYVYNLDQTKWPAEYTPLKWSAINAYVNWLHGPFGQRWAVNADFVMAQRPAMDLNNSGQLDGGDYFVIGKYFARRYIWWPY